MSGHQAIWRDPPEETIDLYPGLTGLPRRILAKIELVPSGCWEWGGYRDRRGYGQARYDARTCYVHTVIYVATVGPVPDGMELDHLCRNPPCCNPCHLEAVTHLENIRRGEWAPARNARKERCPKGHDYVTGTNGRYCPTCRLARRVEVGETSGAGRSETRNHCIRGHEYTQDNMRILYRPDGRFLQRVCKTCERENLRARRRRVSR
jgi:hypothetical protein